jgi:hypothetical protein
MHLDVDRVAFRPEFATSILERADEFAFLGIHGDGRLARHQLPTQRFVDMFELRIPIGMLRALEAFAIGLQTEAEFFQQSRHHLHRDVSLLGEGVHEVALTPR